MKDIIRSVNEHNKKIYEQLEREYALINKYERLLEKHQTKAENIRHQIPRWIDDIVKPLAEKIAKRFNLHYDIYGPFGLKNETTIYWSNKSKFDITDKDTKLVEITLFPKDYTKGNIEYWTGYYDRNDDYIVALLPLDIEDIVQLLKGNRELLGGEN